MRRFSGCEEKEMRGGAMVERPFRIVAAT